MRIVYVTETFPPEINGVALTAERTVRHLRQAGHRVTLVRPAQPDESVRRVDDEWRTPGGPIPMYPELRYGIARAAAFRRDWLEREGGPPDLVHVATPGPLAWAALAAARAEGVATSADFRTNFHAYSRHYRLGWLEPLVLAALRRLHARADTTFVPTVEAAEQLAAQGFSRLTVVGRGVDALRFSPAWRDDWLRREWRAAPEDPVLLYVGRLAAEKNVGLALDTYERLRRRDARLRMVVVGDGPQRARLQQSHRRVHFVGTRRGSELARCFASADVFLFPSLTETFGNVTLEAMASGLAVVAFDTAAARVHLHDGISGWLAPASPGPEGREAFVQAATRALAAVHRGNSVRLEARRAARLASWDNVLASFERRLCALARAAPGPLAHAALA